MAKDIKGFSFAGLAKDLSRDPTGPEWSRYFETNMAEKKPRALAALPANEPTAQLKSKSLPPSGLALPAAESRRKDNSSDPEGLRPNMPKWWNDGWVPKIPPGSCATAECAAGFGPTAPAGTAAPTVGLTWTVHVGVGYGVTASYNTTRGLTYLGAGPQSGAKHHHYWGRSSSDNW